jgi:hypothetical protein
MHFPWLRVLAGYLLACAVGFVLFSLSRWMSHEGVFVLGALAGLFAALAGPGCGRCGRMFAPGFSIEVIRWDSRAGRPKP